MENAITLTIDEIHAIRNEHSRETKDMSFEEYRKLLDAEIAPTLLALERAKAAIKGRKNPAMSQVRP